MSVNGCFALEFIEVNGAYLPISFIGDSARRFSESFNQLQATRWKVESTIT